MADVLSRPGRLPAALVLALSVAACSESGVPDDAIAEIHAPQPSPTLPADRALQGAFIPTVDPMALKHAEIRRVLGRDAACLYHYAADGPPVAAVGLGPQGTGSGVLKLNGNLVALKGLAPETPDSEAMRLAAGPIRLTIIPRGPHQPLVGEARGQRASLELEIGERLHAGFDGFLYCSAQAAQRSGDGG